jgi:hypothetical protein
MKWTTPNLEISQAFQCTPRAPPQQTKKDSPFQPGQTIYHQLQKPHHANTRPSTVPGLLPHHLICQHHQEPELPNTPPSIPQNHKLSLLPCRQLLQAIMASVIPINTVRTSQRSNPSPSSLLSSTHSNTKMDYHDAPCRNTRSRPKYHLDPYSGYLSPPQLGGG